MAQFSVYINTNTETKDNYPFLIDIQNQILDTLETRLVVPMMLVSKYKKKVIKELMPIVDINRKEYVVLVPLMASIHKNNLGQIVADVGSSRQEIVYALDFLITGY
jgi:CcdB protein.